MHELIRRLLRRLSEQSGPRRFAGRPRPLGERGGVLTVATVIIGLGVLTGMSGLVVDVGQIYSEREQLQSGADAAALRLARNCARDPGHCATQSSVAAQYANANAKDGLTQVTLICGTATGLNACPAQTNGLTACIGDVPAGDPYVEVRTGTQLPNGSTLLPATFASAMAGNAAYHGKQILACARAAWGSPYATMVTALTTSVCDWNTLTTNGRVLPPTPDVAPPAQSYESVLYMHDPLDTSGTTCVSGPGGMIAPGGFGWLDDATGSCQAQATVDGTVDGDPGNDPSNPCQARLSTVRLAHSVLLLPVYTTLAGTGQNLTYTVAGVSAFVLTGYNLSGFSAPSWLTGQNLCSGSTRCLYGYFASAVVPGTGSLGGGNFGASIITIVG